MSLTRNLPFFAAFNETLPGEPAPLTNFTTQNDKTTPLTQRNILGDFTRSANFNLGSFLTALQQNPYFLDGFGDDWPVCRDSTGCDFWAAGRLRRRISPLSRLAPRDLPFRRRAVAGLADVSLPPVATSPEIEFPIDLLASPPHEK
jgi:hypothetical protein